MASLIIIFIAAILVKKIIAHFLLQIDHNEPLEYIIIVLSYRI